ncbi:MAG: antitoxin VapB family protein [Candidatus Kariarchaeaceae archaeon]|jgi:predicted CopG family antitoxin
MAKNIAISDDIYNKLTKLKQENESFSDVIRRLISGISNISDLSGRMTFSRAEWKEVESAFNEKKVIDQKRKRELLDKVK